MKNIKYIIGSGVFALLAIFITVSCTDDNDWDVDNSYDRLFSVQTSSLSVSPEAIKAEVKWTKTPETEYYIIEVSKDSLYNEIPMGGNNSIVFGEDKSITGSPYIVTNLDSDSKYFIRIKAMSTTKSESKWTYLEKKSFNTKSEQIMNPVTSQDKTSSTVRLSWEAGAAVTKIELLKGSTIIRTETLGATEIAAGEITFTGLEAGTFYVANLYNNDIRRGYAMFSTFAEAPSADVVIYLNETDVIDQAYLDDLAVQHPGKSITLAMASEATYTIEEKLTIPNNMSINFFGIAGLNKVVLNLLNNIDYAGTHSFITFRNLNIDCGGKGYVMNQSVAATVDKIEFDDCIIQNAATSFFRMQSTAEKTVNSLILNNCVFRNIGSGYYFVHVDTGSGSNKGVVKNLTMSNSTFDNVCATSNGKGFIYSRDTSMESIEITNCTMYAIGGGSNYFVDFASTNNGATSFTITNTILGKTGGNTFRGIRAKTLPSITNTYATSEWYQASNAVTYSNYSGTAADLFTDPENGDFSYKDGSFDSNVGDPQWRQ